MNDITVTKEFYNQLIEYFHEWLQYQNISIFSWNKPYVYLLDGDYMCPNCHDKECDIPILDHDKSLENNKCQSTPIFQGEFGALDCCCICFKFLDENFEENNKQWRFSEFLDEFTSIYLGIPSDIELKEFE